ncbi:STAS domain-containing protein [Dactylosporangium sp. NPDC005555]|uniref:STAS domain-containing protein n=1 Tax=Dactylosporangium sp. NPDC005555 TaxID=3154889 RepID=UPI0033AFB025
MTAATTPDGTDFTLICDACGQSVTGLGATMHNWDLVWSLFRRHGWTGARLATGPHSCGRCSRVPLASADPDPVGWLAGDAPPTAAGYDVVEAPAEPVAETDPRVEAAVVEEALVVSLSGDLDIEVGPALRAALSPAGYRPGHLVLDLSRVATLDSSVLGLLVAARHRAAQAGGHTCLVGLAPFMRRMMHTLCLLHLFVVLPDRATAIGWLRGDDADLPRQRDLRGETTPA